MASAQVCPVIGTTTTVLPPNHPSYDTSDTSLTCPITKAKVEHHDTIHKHPGVSIPNGPDSLSAKSCPALKNANATSPLTDATCPVVGPVSAYLPPGHPKPEDAEEGAVCPKTNAKLEHHAGKVALHPQVEGDASKCPVAGQGQAA